MAPSKVPVVSETARAGYCKVCKEPEEKGKRFLVCGHSLCMYKYYHIRCLSPDQIASEKQEGERRWYCPSCLCRRCYCDMDDNEIVLCDRCDEAYHIYCMEPPLTSVPKGDWYCKSCTEAREQEMYEEKMLKLFRKHPSVMVKSDKYKAFDLLVACAEMQAAKEEAEKLRRVEETAAKKLTAEEEAAAAEKPTGDGEAATAAE